MGICICILLVVYNCLFVCYVFKFVCIVDFFLKDVEFIFQCGLFFNLKVKYECVLKYIDSIKIVTLSWIVDSIKEKKKLDERNYVFFKVEIKIEVEIISFFLIFDENDRTIAIFFFVSVF